MKITKTLLIIASLFLLVAAGSAAAAPKPEIVLVHGAWEEANIWQAVTPLLKKQITAQGRLRDFHPAGTGGNASGLHDAHEGAEQREVFKNGQSLYE